MSLGPLLSAGASFFVDSVRVKLGMRITSPFVVGYTINSACNLRCSYCFIGTDSEHFPEGFANVGLPLEQVKAILANIRKDTSCLIITGGEPFLYKQFDEVLAYAKQELKFANISIASNGMFLEKRKSCLEHIDRLGISYDLTREKEYSKKLADMQESLLRLRKEGVLPPVHFTMTLLPDEDLSALPSFLDFCRENSFRIWLQPVRDHGDFSDWKWFVEIAEEIGSKLGKDCLLNDMKTVRGFLNERPGEMCIPEARMHVNYDGSLLYPCHKLEDLHKAGSVVEKSPMELWREAEKRFGRFPNEQCGDCGFSCYFETAGLYRRPAQFAVRAYRHLSQS